MIEHRGTFGGEGRRIGIVVSRFNELVTQSLLEGARDCLVRHGVSEEAIVVAWVPGAWEIPAVLSRMAAVGRFDALIALGAVIRGATPHFDYVAGGVASGVARVGADSGIPVIFGVLTTDTLEQAFERAGSKAGNKGWESALAALEMAKLFELLAE
jgi:6,7-dimethyl-8-ribityllumazine synthase